MSKLRFEDPGFFTTIQDAGRTGYQQYGMPVAGAMDSESYLLGQRLVGNVPYNAARINAKAPATNTATDLVQGANQPSANPTSAITTATTTKALGLSALECTYTPPTFTVVEGPCVVAFTGANMAPTVNGAPVPLNTPIRLHEGDTVSGAPADPATAGLRLYIAVRGGFAVPTVNNSASTHTKAGIGGLEGRRLQAGDELTIGDSRRPPNLDLGGLPALAVSETYQVPYQKPLLLRVVLGPQADRFTEEAATILQRSSYTITPSSDRMGYRLEGEPLPHSNGADIISDGAVFGSIQVPHNGQPIILMADRQTTGGYTKIATVITPDLPRLAQAGPGKPITFTVISVAEAHRIYKDYIDDLARTVVPTPVTGTIKDVTIDGIHFTVAVQKIK